MPLPAALEQPLAQGSSASSRLIAAITFSSIPLAKNALTTSGAAPLTCSTNSTSSP